ncbi:MAG TPA: MFS transporter [Chloroflexaceae bacterium]|nr:MFS transporter [Chloroflexaceae bacterium]
MPTIRHNHRAFRFLWATQLVATLANELTTIGVVVLVFGSTGSALQATGVLVARNLPPLLFGPFVGSIVDRWPRRALLVAANLARAGLLGAFALAAAAGAGGLWAGYLLVFGLTLVEIVHKPALLATLPVVVPTDRLVWANSVLFTTTQVVFTLGYTVGGVLTTAAGPQLLAALNGGLFLLAAGCAGLMGAIAGPGRAVASVRFWRNVVDGFAYLREHRLARALITVEFLESWPHGVWTSALMLSFTVQALGAGVDAWGYQGGAFFAGQLLGALLALSFARRLARRPGWIIIANGFLMSALTFAYAASPSVLVAVLVSLAFGPPFALRDVAQDSLLQTTVAAEMLGRVYALREMFARMAFLVGGLLFAQLADTVGLREIYALAAALYGLTALYTLWSAVLRRSRLETAPAP